jgi:adenylosuccinate synthase
VSLWVVVGGQFGSEGKGKIAAHIALRENIDLCIRCGGPNSGHSLTTSRDTIVLRQIPTGYVNGTTRLLVPAGALVDLRILHAEIVALGLSPSRIGIDSKAMIIGEIDREKESALGLQRRLSSTMSGVGAAISRRVMREKNVLLARDAARTNRWLAPLLTDVSMEANQAIDSNKKVLVEGTQGFGLSLYHSEFYPKTTSRDTTAAGFLSEVGLSPVLVTDVVLVLRTFPIRVAGEQAGPLLDEINWDTVRKESGYPTPISEYTSVTGKLRRIARFDWALAKAATLVNRPTKLAITGLDYLDYCNYAKRKLRDLSPETRDFIEQMERTLRVPVCYGSASPKLRDAFSLANGFPAAEYANRITQSSSFAKES